MIKGKTDYIWQLVKVIEANLIRLVILGVLLLVVGQLWPTNPAEQVLGNQEQLEDLMAPATKTASLKPAEGLSPNVTLELQGVSSLAKATVLINDAKAGDFSDKTVTVRIKPGDIISIDGSFYHRTTLVRVLHVSPQVTYPKEGQEVVVNSRLVSLEPVECQGISQ